MSFHGGNPGAPKSRGAARRSRARVYAGLSNVSPARFTWPSAVSARRSCACVEIHSGDVPRRRTRGTVSSAQKRARGGLGEGRGRSGRARVRARGGLGEGSGEGEGSREGERWASHHNGAGPVRVIPPAPGRSECFCGACSAPAPRPGPNPRRTGQHWRRRDMGGRRGDTGSRSAARGHRVPIALTAGS